MNGIWTVLRSPIARIIITWHVIWGLVALATAATGLIEVLNGLLLATACGIVVTYTPEIWAGLREERPTKADYLAAGIFLAWFSTVEQRLWSIVWRAIGSPSWFVDTDFATHFFALSLLAALFHLAGPKAINGRIPRPELVRIGIIVAIGVALTLLIAFLGWGRRP